MRTVWVEYNVTAAVTGDGTYSFGLIPTTTDGVSFSSRENSQPAQLVITYGSQSAYTGDGTNPYSSVELNSFSAVRGASVSYVSKPQQQQGSSLTFTTNADAEVNEGSPASNYGTNSQLWVDGDAGASFESYLQFSVSGVTSTVQSAILRVYSTSGTVGGPTVYATDTNWTESGITWNTKPALTSSALDVTGAVATGVWVEYNVTAAVTGDGTYSFGLIPTTTDGVSFSSRENSQPAQLVITYDSQSTTPTATTISTFTPTPSNTPAATSTPTNTPISATNTFTSTPLPPTATNTAASTYTPSNTPVNTSTSTATVTATPTATSSLTPTYTSTPTRTNTPTGATAIPNCGQVTTGPLSLSGNTMFMTITNSTGVALVMQNVNVTWNNDKGHLLGGDKSLSLLQASLGSTVFWSGNVNPVSGSYLITTNTSIPTGTSTITFTFDKSYDTADGTERIYINLATNGCQSYPIDSNPPTPTPTATNPATPTPPPASIFSNAAFTYDGDGNRVKSVITTDIATTTTYFVGSYYEVANGVVTKYYYAGSQRIAMRSGGTLYFMVGDHLGSTSLVTFANGYVVSQMYYKAWGEVRYSSGNSPTNYSYTGQYSYKGDFGLMFYSARWYDPYLNHFTQPDSIVPDPYNPQDWNRYSYGLNNPSRYTDPTGHFADEGCGASSFGGGTSCNLPSPAPPPPPSSGTAGGGGHHGGSNPNGSNSSSKSEDNPFNLDTQLSIDLMLGPNRNINDPEYNGDYPYDTNVPYLPGVSNPSEPNPCLGGAGWATALCALSLVSAIPYSYGPVDTKSNFFITFNVNYNESVGITMSDMQYANLSGERAVLRTIAINDHVIYGNNSYMPVDGTYRPIPNTGGVYSGNDRIKIDVVVFTVVNTSNGALAFPHNGGITLVSLPELKDFMQNYNSTP